VQQANQKPWSDAECKKRKNSTQAALWTLQSSQVQQICMKEMWNFWVETTTGIGDYDQRIALGMTTYNITYHMNSDDMAG
jgi:hypothetical protein